VSAATPSEPLTALREALARTREAGTARVTIDQVWKMRPDARVRSGRIRGALDRLALKGLEATFLRHHVGEGAIDLTRDRCMLDFGEWATIDEAGRYWSGRSGSRLADLKPKPGDTPRAFALLEGLAFAVHASEGEAEDVRGNGCRRLLALLDLNRAPQLATQFSVAEDLHAVPVDVWIDEAHVRRVRFERPPYFEVVLELWDVGRTGELDWTRLPTYRSMGDSAGDSRSDP
jgi:hypothetical protein